MLELLDELLEQQRGGVLHHHTACCLITAWHFQCECNLRRYCCFWIQTLHLLHVFMCRLYGLGSIAQVLEDLSVGVGILQSFSLELYGGQSAVDLVELILVTLLSFQSHQSS